MKKIGMPYQETDEYVSKLVSKATETAVRMQQQSMKPASHKYAVAAVAALLLAGASITYYVKKEVPKQQLAVVHQASPVDDFLNCISDEEAQMLPYYELEVIPEY